MTLPLLTNASDSSHQENSSLFQKVSTNSARSITHFPRASFRNCHWTNWSLDLPYMAKTSPPTPPSFWTPRTVVSRLSIGSSFLITSSIPWCKSRLSSRQWIWRKPLWRWQVFYGNNRRKTWEILRPCLSRFPSWRTSRWNNWKTPLLGWWRWRRVKIASRLFTWALSKRYRSKLLNLEAQMTLFSRAFPPWNIPWSDDLYFNGKDLLGSLLPHV